MTLLKIYPTITRRSTDRSLPAGERLVLPFELRQKRRLRTQLESGEEIGVILERGGGLRVGERLLMDDGRVVEVIAAVEPVSTVRAGDALQLTRIAYHLGNRHVALQIGEGWLRYPQDHVLDDMVRGLGGSLLHEDAPFEPEAGAYDGAHSHAHVHGRA